MYLTISDRGDGYNGHIEGIEEGPTLNQTISRCPSEDEYEGDNDSYEQVAYEVQLPLSFLECFTIV